MTRILLLSDTHGYIDDRILSYAKSADEIWHAGDIGSFEVTEALEKTGKLRAVHGNIDDHRMRSSYAETLYFQCEGLHVLMTHIAQYPGRYAKNTKELLQKHPCDLLISGHSHILKVARDPKLGHMHMNPWRQECTDFTRCAPPYNSRCTKIRSRLYRLLNSEKGEP